MKIFNLIAKYKYSIMVGLCFLLAGVCVLLVLQGMKRDHTYEMMILRNELREEKNREMQQLRSVLLQKDITSREQARMYEISDSIVKANSEHLDRQILLLKSQRDNSYERNKAIDAYGSDELHKYYESLPVYNDY